MTKTLEAVFDGNVFRLEDKIDLIPNRHYILVVREKSEEIASLNAWDVLDTLTGSVEAPHDWSSEHDHYLYGVPKTGRKGHFPGSEHRCTF